MRLPLILAVTGKLLVKDGPVRAGPEHWAERSDHMGVGLVGTYDPNSIGMRLLKRIEGIP